MIHRWPSCLVKATLGAILVVAATSACVSIPPAAPWVSVSRDLRPGVLSGARNFSPTWQDDSALNPRVRIPGGTFVMGSAENNPAADDAERPQHRVTLSDFYLQEHEVTNEEYQRFKPGHLFEAGKAQHPVVGTTWEEAMDYAGWLGGSLPTEAQWEFAARGHGRKYPWGAEDPTCNRANYRGCSSNGTVAVKSNDAGVTPAGIFDLAGNVSEWSSDWYDRYSGEEQADPRGPTDGTHRVLRGGSFDTESRALRVVSRRPGYPPLRRDDVGFRVAFGS